MGEANGFPPFEKGGFLLPRCLGSAIEWLSRGGSSSARPTGPTRDVWGRDTGGLDVPQPPEVLAMILCDQVITDVDTNKKSLIGLFDQIETAALPCVIHELHVYLSLTDGHGTLPVALACVTVDEDEPLFRGDAEIEFHDPLQVVELHFVFPNARFPHSGEYRFQLSAMGQVLGERRFLVTSLREERRIPGC